VLLSSKATLTPTRSVSISLSSRARLAPTRAVFVSLSSKAVVQAVSLRRYTATLSMMCRAIVSSYPIAPGEDCECPPWVVSPAPPCTMSNVETLVNASKKDGTLVNAFVRKGCE
jgi:hypothetical protein